MRTKLVHYCGNWYTDYVLNKKIGLNFKHPEKGYCTLNLELREYFLQFFRWAILVIYSCYILCSKCAGNSIEIVFDLHTKHSWGCHVSTGIHHLLTVGNLVRWLQSWRMIENNFYLFLESLEKMSDLVWCHITLDCSFGTIYLSKFGCLVNYKPC